MSNKIKKISVIFVLIVIVTVLHYSTSMKKAPLHVIYRELYLIPILLGAVWYGMKGGLITSIASSMVYIPCAMMSSSGAPSFFMVSNIAEIATFNIVALIVGRYSDLRRKFILGEKPEKGTQEYKVNELNELDAGRNILICLEPSNDTLKEVDYVARMLTKNEHTRATLLGIFREPKADLFPSENEMNAYRAEKETALEGILLKSAQMLKSSGLGEDQVISKTVRFQHGHAADQIVREQEKGRYDTIVVAGAKMPKQQEFLFGNLPVKVIRSVDCPVITVY
ncbi:MAG: universal stress protein [Deltaproteobacteria bacterium]|nr:universal stress protein [Deltaproteobacteria bacterium]